MKVAIIEDHAVIGELLATLCRRDFRYETFCETTGTGGLELVRRERPDLVVLDISLPDGDGLEVAATIRRELPAARILAFSSLRDARTLWRTRELGLHGYFDKREQSVGRLKEAIRRVAGGECYFSPVYEEVLGRVRRDPRAYHRVLSAYEESILGLIGESKSDAEIAAALGIRESTAQSRRRDIMAKLDIHATPKLIRYAIENGFTRPEHFAPPAPAGSPD